MAVCPLHTPSDSAADELPQLSSDLKRHSVRPEDIQVGDWLRDLGTLRCVASVETLPAAGYSGRIFVVRFVPMPDVKDLALGIPDSVMVMVWRTA